MRKDVSIHEREEVFEVDGEDRPWVCEGQTGKGEIKKRIKRERLRGGRVHVSTMTSRAVEGGEVGVRMKGRKRDVRRRDLPPMTSRTLCRKKQKVVIESWEVFGAVGERVLGGRRDLPQ